MSQLLHSLWICTVKILKTLWLLGLVVEIGDARSASWLPRKILPFIVPWMCLHCEMENRIRVAIEMWILLGSGKAVGTYLYIFERNNLKDEWLGPQFGTWWLWLSQQGGIWARTDSWTRVGAHTSCGLAWVQALGKE